MATMVNGGREDTALDTTVEITPPNPLQVMACTVWDTVWSKAFAVGALVGGALMYAGIRAAQAYLSEDGAQESDRPF